MVQGCSEWSPFRGKGRDIGKGGLKKARHSGIKDALFKCKLINLPSQSVKHRVAHIKDEQIKCGNWQLSQVPIGNS